MACTNLKRALSKKWQRVTESRYTKAFVMLSIIQVVILVFLEVRILYRNATFYMDIVDIDESGKECTLGIVTFILLMLENVMLVFFNIYQLYFCLNAIFHQNTMQIFALVIINIGHVILGIIQTVEVKFIVKQIKSECPDVKLGYDLASHEIPYILVLATIAIFKAGLSWKLYQEFGWNIYKKIGGDIEMQKRLRTSLIFVMLLKINLLFVIVYNSLISPILIYSTTLIDTGIRQKVLCYTCVTISILVFFFQILAYKSMEKEWKAGMIIFIILWIITIADFAWLALVSVAVMVPYGLYSWITLMCIFIVCSVLTLIYAILVTRNFGKGIKQYYFDKRRKKQHEGTSVLDDDIVTDDDKEKAPNSNNKKKFTID